MYVRICKDVLLVLATNRIDRLLQTILPAVDGTYVDMYVLGCGSGEDTYVCTNFYLKFAQSSSECIWQQIHIQINLADFRYHHCQQQGSPKNKRDLHWNLC